MACYVHDLPGRMRVKIPTLKRNRRVADKAQRLLDRLPGVSSTALNLVTGSIVIHFSPDVISSRYIMEYLAVNGYIDPSKCLSSEEYTSRALSRAGRYLSRAVLGLALDEAFSNTSLSFLTVLV